MFFRQEIKKGDVTRKFRFLSVSNSGGQFQGFSTGAPTRAGNNQLLKPRQAVDESKYPEDCKANSGGITLSLRTIRTSVPVGKVVYDEDPISFQKLWLAVRIHNPFIIGDVSREKFKRSHPEMIPSVSADEWDRNIVKKSIETKKDQKEPIIAELVKRVPGKNLRDEVLRNLDMLGPVCKDHPATKVLWLGQQAENSEQVTYEAKIEDEVKKKLAPQRGHLADLENKLIQSCNNLKKRFETQKWKDSWKKLVEGFMAFERGKITPGSGQSPLRASQNLRGSSAAED